MEITIKAPKDLDCGMPQWQAKYTVYGTEEVRLIRIQSRSSIDLVIAKITEEGYWGSQGNYYISSPNFGIAIPSIPSLQETFWITEQLLNHDMPMPDAVTVADVLKDMGDF